MAEAGATSNLGEIAAALERLAHVADLDNAARGRPLAEELFDTVAVGIQQRSVQQQAAPEGEGWAALSPKYRDRKVREGYPATIGVRTGDMLSVDELRGETEIGPDEATMTYGSDEETKQRAGWFQEGSDRQPARPFYDLDDEIEKEMDRVVEEHLDAAFDALAG